MVRKGRNAEIKTSITWKRAIKRDWEMYVWVSIPLLLILIFYFGAYPGLRIAL